MTSRSDGLHTLKRFLESFFGDLQSQIEDYEDCDEIIEEMKTNYPFSESEEEQMDIASFLCEDLRYKLEEVQGTVQDIIESVYGPP